MLCTSFHLFLSSLPAFIFQDSHEELPPHPRPPKPDVDLKPLTGTVLLLLHVAKLAIEKEIDPQTCVDKRLIEGFRDTLLARLARIFQHSAAAGEKMKFLRANRHAKRQESPQ